MSFQLPNTTTASTTGFSFGLTSTPVAGNLVAAKPGLSFGANIGAGDAAKPATGLTFGTPTTAAPLTFGAASATAAPLTFGAAPAAAAPLTFGAAPVAASTAPTLGTGFFAQPTAAAAPTSATSTASSLAPAATPVGAATQFNFKAPTTATSTAATTAAVPALNLAKTTAAATFSFAPPAATTASALGAATATTTSGGGFTSLTTATNTTASTSAATAPPALTFNQLEEHINKWTLELEEQEKLFMDQATQVNAWDKILIGNNQKILELNDAVQKVKGDQQALEQELEFIATQHKDLEESIAPLQKELMKMPQVDMERSQTYLMVENLDTQLKQMSEDLKEIVDNLNESNKGQTSNDPIVQIVKILNAHMNSLQWIDQTSANISLKIDEITKMQESIKRDSERSFRSAYYSN